MAIISGTAAAVAAAAAKAAPLVAKVGSVAKTVGGLAKSAGAISSGISTAKSLLGGGPRGASVDYGAQAAAAPGQIRSTADIIREAYGPEGIYDPEIQEFILGTEQRLLPQFTELQKLRAQDVLFGEGGLSELRRQERLEQLAEVGELGATIREQLEDPRMRELAQLDVEEAIRQTEAARGPLGFEAGREAEQAALAVGQATGREKDFITAARAALGRQEQVEQRADRAAEARRRARQAVQATAVDPSQFLFGGAPSAASLAAGFLGQQPGPIVTDPGALVNLGLVRDQNLLQSQMMGSLIGAQRGAGAAGMQASRLQPMSRLGELGGVIGGIQEGFEGLSETLGGFKRPTSQTFAGPGDPGFGTIFLPPPGGF